MIDPQQYDDAERLAMSQIGDWRIINTFRPNFFEAGGFPIKISNTGEIRYLFSVMNGAMDADRVLRELRGLRVDDMKIIMRAISKFVKFHITTFGSMSVSIPFTSFLYYYSLYKKLMNFPNHKSILDIGPGLGYLSLFFSDDNSFQRYNQIEVTQSLYVLQSCLNSFVFQQDQQNLGVSFPDLANYALPLRLPDGRRADDTIDLALDQSFRCSLYPWWKLNDAFKQKYDIIMCNENMCEMDTVSFVFFAQKIRECLTPDGVFFVHGFGKTTGDKAKLIQHRLDVLASIGYRVIVSETSFENNGSLSRPNLILSHNNHQSYERHSDRFNVRNFDAADPMVRSIYGLNAPDGDIRDLESFRSAIVKSIGSAP
jgi:hypothetical protein